MGYQGTGNHGWGVSWIEGTKDRGVRVPRMGSYRNKGGNMGRGYHEEGYRYEGTMERGYHG
jgi:hypothetical protein